MAFPASLRPTLVDYIFLMGGICLSLYLMDIAPLRAEAAESEESPAARQVVEFLPRAMRLSEGVILLLPIFYATQQLRGRRQPLTGAEWLWVVSWVGVAVLSGVGISDLLGATPDMAQRWGSTLRRLWYVVFVPSMGALALLLTLAGLLRRGPPPWTHSLGLTLVLWPLAPLAGILTLGRFV
jgi:hypothetical protein